MNGNRADVVRDAIRQADGAVEGLPADLEQRLDAMVSTARAAWPDVHLDESAFLRRIARTLAEGEGAGLDDLCTTDLYLATACAAGDPRAQQALDRQFLVEVEGFLSRSGTSATQAADVRQALLERLLVPPAGGLPRIGEYAGRGPLGGFLRVAATRLAINLHGRKRVEVALDPAGREGTFEAPGVGPEVALIRRRFREEFKSALEAAVGKLPANQRGALRMHFIDDLGIDAIAPVFDVHRATAARWIQRGTDAILTELRAILEERLRISSTELESLMGMARSEMDLSLHALFGSHH